MQALSVAGVMQRLVVRVYMQIAKVIGLYCWTVVRRK